MRDVKSVKDSAGAGTTFFFYIECRNKIYLDGCGCVLLLLALVNIDLFACLVFV